MLRCVIHVFTKILIDTVFISFIFVMMILFVILSKFNVRVINRNQE